MASATIAAQQFPSGTVTVYPASNWLQHQLPPTGAPVGSSTTSASVSGGSVAFTGLADDTRYYAYQLVGSEHRYVAFSTFEDVPPAQRVTTETGLDVPRTLFERTGATANGGAIGTYVLAPRQEFALAINSGSAYTAALSFDPATYAIAGKTTEISVAGLMVQPSGTQTAAMSIGLRSVSSITSGGNVTLGSAVTTALLIPAGSAAGNYPGRSSWVAAPSSGLYVLTCEVATAATAQNTFIEARLDVRYV